MNCEMYPISCQLEELVHTIGTPSLLEWLTFAVSFLAAAGTLAIAWMNLRLLRRQHTLARRQHQEERRSALVSERRKVVRELLKLVSNRAEGLTNSEGDPPRLSSTELTMAVNTCSDETARDIPGKTWMLMYLLPVNTKNRWDVEHHLTRIELCLSEWAEDPDAGMESIMREFSILGNTDFFPDDWTPPGELNLPTQDLKEPPK